MSFLVAHENEICNTTAATGHYSTLASRGQLEPFCPPLPPPLRVGCPRLFPQGCQKHVEIWVVGSRLTIGAPQPQSSGSEKGVFWKRGLFRKVHFLEILENREILENPQIVENKGESDHHLEALESIRKRAEYGFGEYRFKHQTQ